MDSSKPHAEGERSSNAPVTCKKEDEKVCCSSLPSSSSTTSTSTLPLALDASDAPEALPASVHALQIKDVKDATETLVEHSLPLAKHRTNVAGEDYTPRGRLFGGYTTREEGMTQFSLRCPVHIDKNNHRRTWLTAFGNYEGGRLWVESPVGSHAPPTAKCDWRTRSFL